MASIGSLATLAYGSQLAADLPAGLPAGVSGTARESVIGGIAAAQQVSGALGAQLLDVVRAAFSTGVNLGGGVGAIVTVGLIALAVVSFRHVRPIGQPYQNHHQASSIPRHRQSERRPDPVWIPRLRALPKQLR